MQRSAPGASPYAEVRETHAGVVFLVGDRAYKLKRPEDFGFLDYSTRELRRAACLREVELNRRMAPDVYEGVLDVVGEDGRPVEHLVMMRRMPEHLRLSDLVRRKAVSGMEMRRVARSLAVLHARAEPGPEVAREGEAAALRGRWVDNIDQARPFEWTVLDGGLAEIERSALRFVAGRGPLLAARASSGRTVDGHGDLLADDVFCLEDGPRILDCLEFDDRLRWLDGLDDAAFLAMDLERLGASGLGEEFLAAYTAFLNDPAPPALYHHYIAYRAFVRAKVACLRHAQGAEEAESEARSLERIALDRLRRGAVRLVLVGGLPGTGKSTLAGRIADRLGAVLLSSDRVRKESAGLAPLRSAAAPYGEGIYTPEMTGRVYRTLLERARKLLEHGESVVLDASWAAEPHRRAAARLAETAAAEQAQVRCSAPADLVARRLAERTAGEGVSDAGAAVARAMAADFHPWPEANRIDTSRTGAEAAEAALAVTGPRPLPSPRRPRPTLPAD